MIAAEVTVIGVVAVLVVMFAPTPLVAVGICVSAIAVLYGSPHLVAAVVAWWQERAAASEQRLADAAARKTGDAQRVLAQLPTQRAGRHRPENAGPDAVSGTDNLRRANTAALERHQLMLAAAEADRAGA